MDNSSNVTDLTNKVDTIQLNELDISEICNNPFLKDLGDIMSKEQFTSFFDKHFSSIEDTKVAIIYMKLYREIQLKYELTHSDKLDKITSLYLIQYIMSSKDLRPKAINTISNTILNSNSNCKSNSSFPAISP